MCRPDSRHDRRASLQCQDRVRQLGFVTLTFDRLTNGYRCYLRLTL